VAYFVGLFLIIVISNLLGRVPFQFTYTSRIVFNLVLSSQVIFSAYLYNYAKYGINRLNPLLFINIDIILIKFARTLIELISIVARIFSLAIRLFANMLAGHIMLHRLVGSLFVVTRLSSLVLIKKLIILVSSLPVLSFILSLERAVAVLQAYVFIVLARLYIAEVDLY